MKLEKWHLSITLVCLLFGTLFTSNLKTQLQEYNPLAARNTTLVTVINTQEKRNKDLESEITNIRAKLEDHQANKTEQTVLEPLKHNMDRLKLFSGLTGVEGPGVVITLDDHDKASTAKDPEFYIIHYSSILYIVNDLRAAGAEAIAVNGNRVVSITDIRCAGSIILVNTHRLAPPFEITAIGNPQLLEDVVKTGEYTTLELGNFPITLDKKNKITLPAYEGSYAFSYASPVKEGENE